VNARLIFLRLSGFLTCKTTACNNELHENLKSLEWRDSKIDGTRIGKYSS